MKELWDQALLSYNLPLTVALGVVVIFWVLSLVGAIDFDGLDFDFEADVEVEVGTESGGGLGGAFGFLLRFVNANEVPVMIILSLLAIFMWVFSIGMNFYFNPGQSDLLAIGFLAGNFLVSVVLIKVVTTPLKGLFHSMRHDQEHQEPLIGSTGVVRSGTLTEEFGQCEVVRPNGAPALLNCRLPEGSGVLPRGTEILVIGFDAASQKYLIQPSNLEN